MAKQGKTQENAKTSGGEEDLGESALSGVAGGMQVAGHWVPNPVKAIRNRLPKALGGREKGSLNAPNRTPTEHDSVWPEGRNPIKGIRNRLPPALGGRTPSRNR